MRSASVSASIGGASVPDSPAAGRQGLRLVLLLLAALALYAIPLGWGLGVGSEWALDEPKLRQIVPELFEGGLGWPQRYPPLHRQLLSALVRTAHPLAEAANPATGIEVEVLLRGLGRALSLTMAIGTLLLVFSIARRLFGTRAALLSALVWLGVAPQAYYAKTMNLDAPYVFWFALALEFFTRLQPEVRARDLVGFALAGGAAILTKDQAGGLFVLPALLILTWIYRAARARGAGALAALGKTAFDPRIAGAALAMLLLVAVVYRFWNGLGELEAHLREISSWNSVGRYQESPNTLAGHLQVAGRSGLNLAFCLGWPGLGVGVAAVARELWVARSSGSRALPLLAFPLSYYLFFVASIRFSFDRFFLPVALVVALFSGGLLARFLETAPRDGARRWRACAVALLLAYGISRSVAVDLSMLFDARNAAERWVAGKGQAVGLMGVKNQLPRGFDAFPMFRLKSRVCQQLQGARFVAFQPLVGRGPVAARVLSGLETGALGFRRVSLPRFEPPRWLYAPDLDTSNLAWIDDPLWLYERDPGRECREPARR